MQHFSNTVQYSHISMFNTSEQRTQCHAVCGSMLGIDVFRREDPLSGQESRPTLSIGAIYLKVQVARLGSLVGSNVIPE